MQVRLKVMQGSKAGSEIKVPGPMCLIGRADECHLRPQSEAISRQHCSIIIKENEVCVRDLKSRNGTFVNDERVTEESVLLSGDVLRVGPLEFEVLVEQTVSKAKRPKVQDLKDMAARTAGGGGGSQTAELSNIGDWLDEGDQSERMIRKAEPETRQFRVDDTNAGIQPPTAGEDVPTTEETKAIDPTMKKGEKKAPGKLPPRDQAQSANSRDAAADMLKKFFNRR